MAAFLYRYNEQSPSAIKLNKGYDSNMNRMMFEAYRILRQFRLTLVLMAMAASASGEPAVEDWQKVVRTSPFWESQGAYHNLVTLRRWVLAGESYCARNERHIFFDRRATFLGYIDDGPDIQATQQRLNRERQAMAEAGKVDHWVAGESGQIGYPFALSCDQPHADLQAALARYSGKDASARLWGTWDGMRLGSPEQTVSLHRAVLKVYSDRKQKGRVDLPEDVLSTLAGKILIESGGRKAAHSAADARGVLQLSVAALKDCELEPQFHYHRLAQIDCALKLLEQNHRNLEPVFQERFGHLPKAKAGRLYAMLLIQAYHGGVGRISALMNDPKLDSAARYFAQHHQRFSAGDIALGMVFHNLGRNQLGFASLYYVTDVGIAIEAACAALDNLPGCEEI